MKKKKIMILGGSRYIIPVIKKAHELGMFVITCDYLPNNYAHKFSDKYLNISIIDKNAVLDAAKKEQIDGIISFACDPGVITAAYVAEKMGLPNVGPYESICIMQNKYLFRSFLKKHNFNTPEFAVFSNKKDACIKLKNVKLPIIIKPTDSAGSKGVSKISDVSEIDSAVDNAFQFSHKKEIIVEEFVEFKSNPSDADSFFKDGQILYFGLNSQLFDKNALNPYTPAGYYWPSTISQSNQIFLKNELVRLFKLLKLNTCILNIEVREDINGRPFIMEASPRGGGNRLTEMIKIGSNIDFIEPYLNYSVGNKVSTEKIKQIDINGLFEYIVHSDRDGIFSKIEIDNYIKKYVIENDLWVKKGDIVKSFSGANQTIGTIVLKFENSKQADDFFKNSNKYIKVMLDD